MQQAEPIPLTKLLDKRAELEAELQKGQALLQQTQTTVLRIQGALTLLQELLAAETKEPKIVALERTNGRKRHAEVPEEIS